MDVTAPNITSSHDKVHREGEEMILPALLFRKAKLAQRPPTVPN
jgi:hypothetical protein